MCRPPSMSLRESNICRESLEAREAMQQSFNWHTAEADEPYRAIAFHVVLLRSTMAWWLDQAIFLLLVRDLEVQ